MTMPDPMLVRETLSEQIASNLREFILTDLNPGDLLPSESRLAERFGVSRPVIREALRSLGGQGLIEIVTGRGAVVQPIDDRPLRLFFRRSIHAEGNTVLELMEVRKPLEMQSAALAAERRTEQQLEKLGAKVQAMRQALEDLKRYAILDVEFHMVVAEASHNQIMIHLIGSVRESLHEAIEQGLRRRNSREELERVQVLHELVYDAVAAANPVDAATAMARHFDEAVTALVTGIDA